MSKVTLEKLKMQLNVGEVEIETLHLIQMHNYLYHLDMSDRLEAMKLLHHFFRQNCIEETGAAKQLLESGRVDDERQTFEEYRDLQIERSSDLLSRLQTIERLQKLYETDEKLEFDQNKVYGVKGWQYSHTSTGERSSDITSTKAKIMTNSAFENAYNEFISGISSHPLPYDTSGIAYIMVKPSYGPYNKYPIMLRSDQLY
jgi:hypothetical protein